MWRSLDELANKPEVQQWLQSEFPSVQIESLSNVSRRRFLQASAASLVLAGVIGCEVQPPERIVAAVRGEDGFTPGKPEYFATTLSSGPSELGVLIENHMGRPTKIEGNPDHPGSLGATDAMTQAQILTLYDPARSQAIYNRDQIATWERFVQALRRQIERANQRKGKGLFVLTPTLRSPTLIEQIAMLLRRLPQARWCVHDAIDDDNARDGLQAAFGPEASPVIHIDQANVILALDRDFLGADPSSVRYTREFANRRRVNRGASAATANRLYVAEPCPTVTGGQADHRLAVRAGRIIALLLRIAERFEALPAEADVRSVPNLDAAQREWCDEAANDLARHNGAAVVLIGRSQPAAAHALAWAINSKLRALGGVVSLIAKPALPAHESLERLADAIKRKAADSIIILDANPAYDAPIDLQFASLLRDVPYTAHLGLYRDETARHCQWHVPAAHALETWSDARSCDGVTSLVQPLIRPLYGGKSAHELMAVMNENAQLTGRDIVRRSWKERRGQDKFETWWRGSLKKGVAELAKKSTTSAKVRDSDIANSLSEYLNKNNEARPQTARPEAARSNAVDEGGSLEIRFAGDYSAWDGQFAPNAWMQELPDPITKLCWSNAALISPSTADRLRLSNEQIVTMRLGERVIDAPVWIVPGHADDSISLPLGYGRELPGSAADRVGFNAYALRSSAAPWFTDGIELSPTSRRQRLICTQHHHAMEGRDFVRVASSSEKSHDQSKRENHAKTIALSLYPDRPMTGPQWGMVIDLTRCTGCNACVVACQAENNIPVVGADEVARGREMHWIRVDRYFEGPPDSPAIHHQPVPCMHCENAPCEVVCPVEATSHSADGLNEMTYNRCVGTRYCSNNCPYKVRRFNFLQYADRDSETLKMQRNPDVTVRTRGVMEKCTYCVQRIRTAEIDARKSGKSIDSAELVTACQQVCPGAAIVFGDINDPESEVAALRKHPHHYGLLTHLNTRPRTTYLADTRNKNRELG